MISSLNEVNENLLSPMMRHYADTKKLYSDCILFYRLGDFYEMFFEDAIKASKILDLTLTGKECGLSERAPMCGVPFHAADVYISKLVAAGEKVAICEQLSVPNGKQLVDRDVVKTVTAGTVTNNELIDDKTNNFIASVYVTENASSVSWSDITTGEFYTKSFSGPDNLGLLSDEIVKIAPAEIISNAEAEKVFKNMPIVVHGVVPQFYAYPDSNYSFINAEKSLKEQFGVMSLSSFDLENDKLCISSSGALMAYLKETQKHTLGIINGIKKVFDNEFMMLDSCAVNNLELVKTLREGKRYGSLLWLLDKTKTSMGARKLQSWILSPLVSVAAVNERLSGVNALYKNTMTGESLANLLSSVKDIGRLTGRISNGNLNPRDCVNLCKSLDVLPSIKFQLLGLDSKVLSEIEKNITDFSELVKFLLSAIDEETTVTDAKDGGFIKKGFSRELDEFAELSSNTKEIIGKLEARERDRLGIKNLKISYNRVFGYYIELTNSVKNLAPYDYKCIQTLSNSERYVTDELKKLEVKILTSEEKRLALEVDIFNRIKEVLAGKIAELKNTSDAIATLDVLLSFATVAKDRNYCMPTLTDGEEIIIKNGRHPVVEAISRQRYVPNDCLLDGGENRTMIITGPNMAGKSTFMRQVALITLMAHMGCFVPADSATISVTDRIFTRIGASDSLITDQSTFMVEMSEVANITKNATKKSLLILDEIGRGTSTFDGLSIAWAVVEYITSKIGAKTMFATHYHELTELEGRLSGVKNYKVTVKELQGGIVFLRKIMRGGANKSFGIEVAELAGIDKNITDLAREILKTLEKSDVMRRNNDSLSACDETAVTSDCVIDDNVKAVGRIIADLDIDNVSPMQAFNILADLKEKIKG